MKINFKAMVKHYDLSPNTPLVPLFEAIVNSIQSIEENGKDNGCIKVKIERESSLLQDEASGRENDINSFEIIDNGIGFNDKNFESFDVYGSEYKSHKGCKGVGRITWLKAFSSVSVESTYYDGNEYHNRVFEFSTAKECELISDKLSEKNQPGTRVVLKNYFANYKAKCPKKLDTLARDVMNHCFAYLTLDTCPLMYIEDEKDTICINTLFKDNTKGETKTVSFEIKGRSFNLINAKNYSASSDKNILHFCAHKREVNGKNLASYIKTLNGKLYDSNEEEFVYVGYITSDYLDENINSKRTDFAILKDNDDEEYEQVVMDDVLKRKDITINDIINAAIPIIEEYLLEEIKNHNAKKRERIEKYVRTSNPRYRSLLKYDPKCIERIPYYQDDTKLELELFKQEQTYRLSMLKEQTKLAQGGIDDNVGLEDYMEKSNELLKKVSDFSKDDLAQYITHRKTILDIFSSYLKYTDENKKTYALEKSIHNIIFPMKHTSDEIDYSNHNLWIIDEKLSYHYYLASDKAISSYDVIESDCSKEPDIVIFGPAFALTGDSHDDGINNITIIEFKRPGRSDKECVDQVTNYINNIRSGKCKQKNGQILAEMTYENARFYCYILCDIAGEMAEFLEGRTFKKTPDGKSYYLYHDQYKAYIEVIPYSKMLNDSKKRNKILFDKLFGNTP